MKHYMLFIVRDTHQPRAILRFLDDYRREHRSLTSHLAYSGAPHLRQLLQCGGRLQLGFVHATLAPVRACHSTVKCWYDSELEKVETAVEAIYNALQPFAENINDSILIPHSDLVSIIVDHLLDSLPAPNVSRLHIVLDEQLVHLWPFASACELLAGSLLRSVEWHKALFYPLGGESGRPLITEWLEPLECAPPVSPSDKVLFSTHIDNFPVHIAVDIICSEPFPSKHTLEDDCRAGGTRWSPSCEVIAQVELQSVPLTLFCPGLSMYASDTEFLDQRRVGRTDGLLIRLNGWPDIAAQPETALTTRAWREAVRRRNLELPSNTEDAEPTLAIHFILASSGAAYPLVNDVNLDFLADFRPFQISALPDVQELPLLGSFLKSAEERSRLAHLQAGDPYPYLVDPADWPMRARLLPPEEDKDSLQPAPKALAWNAKEIAALFDTQTGLGLMSTEAASPLSLPDVGLNMKPTLDIAAAQQMPWPDILRHTSHDVYYNRSPEDERWERACHRWKEGALKRPTATSLDCPPSDSRVFVPASKATDVSKKSRHSPRKNLFDTSPQYRRRSPRKHKQTSPFRNLSQVLRRNPFRDILREVSNSAGDSDGGLSSGTSQTLNSSSTQPTSSGRVRSFSKMDSSQDATQSSQPVAKRRRPDSVDNEKLKRKLRAAVAAALEEHGIDLKHPLFSTCGKKLFTICKTFAVDLIGTGRTSEILLNVAKSHAKQVVDFELSLSRLASS